MEPRSLPMWVSLSSLDALSCESRRLVPVGARQAVAAPWSPPPPQLIRRHVAGPGLVSCLPDCPDLVRRQTHPLPFMAKSSLAELYQEKTKLCLHTCACVRTFEGRDVFCLHKLDS